MFRTISLTTLLALSFQAQAVSVDQELAACSAAWTAGKNRDFAKAVNLSDPQKCPLTHSFMTWKKLRSDNISSPFSEYTRFISKHEDWPWMPLLKTKAEKAITAKTSDKEILAWYGNRDPHTATGAISYLKALQASKDANKVKTVFSKAWRRLDLSESQENALLSQFGKHLQQEDHRRRTEFLFNGEKLDQAKRMLPLLSAENKAWAQARIAFIENHEDPHKFLNGTNKSHDLIYEQLRWHRKRDDLAGAHLLKSVPSKHTHDSIWWRERAFFAREALNQGDPQMAYELMASHPYTDGKEFADAEWFCGFVALRFLKDTDKAFDHFKKFAHMATLPRSKAKASFWLARTYETIGDEKQAELAYRETAKYPATYYGMIAKRKFEKDVKLSFAKDPAYDSKQWAAFQNKEFVRLSRLLSKVGWGVEAEPFLYLLANRTSKGTKEEKIMGLKVINETYSPYTVFGSLDIRYQEADLFPWLYPRRSLDANVKNQGIDPHLLHAVMRQESGFNQGVKSPAGAIGMMQVMPQTGATVAKKKGYKHTESRIASDANYNMLLGSHYLKEMLDLFDGSYLLAVAAYNAGPGPVKKWVEKYGDPRTNQVDTVDFIERIPYSETREYVKSVLANFYVYQALEK
jgi:soluble lytic murein transglycosylase